MNLLILSYENIVEFISRVIILNKLCLDNKGTLWLGLSRGLYKKEIDGRITPVIHEQLHY